MFDLGKALILLGLFLAFLGLVLTLGAKIPWLGQLPGDIVIRRGNFTFYFPLATSVIVSVILTLVLYFFRR
jgi:uncharacterized protein HemY